MAASRGQKIGIWIIATIMAVGTIGSFAVIILANDNQQAEQARINEAYATYQKDVEAQSKELSDKYFTEFNSHAGRVGAFDAAGVAALSTVDLKIGDGEVITKDSSFTAYYLGWNPSGEIFDGSIDNGKLKPPYTVAPGAVIVGWTEGVDGMKVGGIREVAIPSNKAYGETGSGDKIPPNTPLKFIIMIIPTPEEIPFPTELLQT